MYRPKDWEGIITECVLRDTEQDDNYNVGFEAGADAMLEALGEMTYGNIYDKDWYINRSKGKWVFIPDEA